MKEKINSILVSAWSSLYGGIDADKATSNLHIYVVEELAKQKEELVLLYTKQLLRKEELIDSFEIDMENSNSLLVEALEELGRLKNIDSNNPRKLAEVKHLIFRIEEQIIENGK